MSMEDELREMLALGPAKSEENDDAQNSTKEVDIEDERLEEETTEEVETDSTEESEGDVDETEDAFDGPSDGDPRNFEEDGSDVDEDDDEVDDDPDGDSDEVAGLKAQIAQMQTMMQQVFVGGMLPGVQNQQVNQQVAPQTGSADQSAELDPQKFLEGVDFDQVFVDPQAFAGVLLNVVKAAQSGASQQATQAVQAAQKQQEQRAAVDNFWQQNPDLTNFRTQLAAVTQNIGATNPSLKSTDEILEAAGQTVRALYGLKPKAGKAKTTSTKGKGKANVKRSLKSPAKARKQGGSRQKKVSKKNKSTGMQAEIDAMFNLET